MKRNRLLVACLALLLVLSIGYALFSEQVNVTGTIKGKGDFDVTPTCTLGYSDDLINAGVATSTDMNQKGFGEDSCDIVDGKVEFTTNLDYPGAKRYFTVKVENTGTIPATFDSEGLDAALEQWFDAITSSRPGGGQVFQYYNDKNEVVSADIFKIIDAGIIESNNYCSYKDLCFDNFQSIKTGESVYFVLAFEWPEDYARNYSYEGSEVYYVFHGRMSIPFQQIQLN